MTVESGWPSEQRIRQRVGRPPGRALFGISTAVLLALCTQPGPASAHDVTITSMARIFIDQVAERRYVLSAVDVGLPPLDAATVTGMLPGHCAPMGGWEPALTSQAPPTLSFECTQALGSGDEILLPWDLAGVVVVFRSIDGVDSSGYFVGRGRTVPIDVGELSTGGASRLRVVARYVIIGAEHILFGTDHLLFVLGLLLLVSGIRSLVVTITAFTVAHSLTLAAAVLGFVSMHRGAVEAAIALSIILLAREVVISRRDGESLVQRRPWLVAFGFGLLHGFGFAGALGEIGLQGVDVPSALLSFNLGVEFGQLFFVLVLILLGSVGRRVTSIDGHRLVRYVGYALGALATLWFIDRLPGVWVGPI